MVSPESLLTKVRCSRHRNLLVGLIKMFAFFSLLLSLCKRRTIKSSLRFVTKSQHVKEAVFPTIIGKSLMKSTIISCFFQLHMLLEGSLKDSVKQSIGNHSTKNQKKCLWAKIWLICKNQISYQRIFHRNLAKSMFTCTEPFVH